MIGYEDNAEDGDASNNFVHCRRHAVDATDAAAAMRTIVHYLGVQVLRANQHYPPRSASVGEVSTPSVRGRWLVLLVLVCTRE